MVSKQADQRWYSYTSSTETMRAWVREINSLAEVPDDFQSVIPKSMPDFESGLFIPPIIYSPSRERKAKLLLFDQEQFSLLTRQNKNEIQLQTCSYNEVYCLERGKVLLHSWLNIITGSNNFNLSFNTTHEKLFTPFSDKIRAVMNSTTENVISSSTPQNDEDQRAKLDFLSSHNYKFMNYARGSLFPGAEIIGMIYEPERTIFQVGVFERPLLRIAATDHLTLITEGEIIHFKEKKKITRPGTKHHGGIITFLSRRAIPDLNSVKDQANDLTRIEIKSGNEKILQLDYSTATQDLDHLLAILRKAA